jgi:hypothetical protein
VVSPALRSSTNIVHSCRWSAGKKDASDSRSKGNTDCALKYRRGHLNSSVQARRKFNSDCFCKRYPSRFPRSCAARAAQSQIR